MVICHKNRLTQSLASSLTVHDDDDDYDGLDRGTSALLFSSSRRGTG